MKQIIRFMEMNTFSQTYWKNEGTQNTYTINKRGDITIISIDIKIVIEYYKKILI